MKDFSSRIYFFNAPFSKTGNHVCDDPKLQTKLLREQYLIAYEHSYSYIRQTGAIRVALPIENIIDANYLLFRNPQHENMNYLAYIDSLEYVNENLTDVFFTVDYFSTFHHLVEYCSTFVVREHVADDSLGLHTVPEGIETGPMRGNSTILEGTNQNRIVPPYPCFIIALSDHYYKEGNRNKASYAEGMPNGFALYVFPYRNMRNCSWFLEDMKESGTTGAIAGFYLGNQYAVFSEQYGKEAGTIDFELDAPEPMWGNMAEHNEFFNVKNIIPDSFEHATDLYFHVQCEFNKIGKYQPKNNKLFAYPYNYLEVHNNQGSLIRFRHEQMVHDEAHALPYGHYYFNVRTQMFNLNPMMKLWCVNNRGNEYDEAITLGDFVQLPYPTDNYAVWALNNQGSIKARNFQQATSQARGVMNVATSAFSSGSLIGGLMTALTGSANLYIDHQNFVAQTMAMHEDQQAKRSQMAGSLGGNTLNFINMRHTFEARQMSVNREYARIIDGYFNQYGYKVNRVGVPETNSRPQWNYVKCADAIVKGPIPHQAKKQIEDKMNNGVTIWHDLDTFLDYSKDNPPQEGAAPYYAKRETEKVFK